jgi:DNA-binding MarR family transcriptional regulator
MFPLYQAALIHFKAYRLLRAEVTKMVKHFDLSMHEWVVLSVLEHRKTRKTSDLAEELGVELPLITQVTYSLEDRKLIGRHTGENDKRQRHFSLTEQGLSLIKKTEEYMIEYFKVNFPKLSLTDIRGHLKVLQVIIETYEKTTQPQW